MTLPTALRSEPTRSRNSAPSEGEGNSGSGAQAASSHTEERCRRFGGRRVPTPVGFLRLLLSAFGAGTFWFQGCLVQCRASPALTLSQKRTHPGSFLPCIPLARRVTLEARPLNARF